MRPLGGEAVEAGDLRPARAVSERPLGDVAELKVDIMSFIDAHNEQPKPYKWVKSADEILASVKRFCLKMNEQGTNDGV